MVQKTFEKLNQEISHLREEIKTLRSFVIGVAAKDQEGEYRPEFVKKILSLSKKRGGYIFRDAKSFLKQIQKSS